MANLNLNGNRIKNNNIITADLKKIVFVFQFFLFPKYGNNILVSEINTNCSPIAVKWFLFTNK